MKVINLTKPPMSPKSNLSDLDDSRRDHPGVVVFVRAVEDSRIFYVEVLVVLGASTAEQTVGEVVHWVSVRGEQ